MKSMLASLPSLPTVRQSAESRPHSLWRVSSSPFTKKRVTTTRSCVDQQYSSLQMGWGEWIALRVKPLLGVEASFAVHIHEFIDKAESSSWLFPRESLFGKLGVAWMALPFSAQERGLIHSLTHCKECLPTPSNQKDWWKHLMTMWPNSA